MLFPGLLFGAPFVGGFLGGLLGGALAPRPFYPPYPPYPRIQAGGINQRFMKEE
ncbi:hypothetical protein LR69_01157 [Geobacillus sp. BCO2]|nr:hypothetical protein LR69_01157 [Geobacillus sp. BCO2]